jgi:hypothetical protein
MSTRRVGGGGAGGAPRTVDATDKSRAGRQSFEYGMGDESWVEAGG